MPNELNLPDIDATIDLLIRGGVRYIWFMGGDPFMKKGFELVIKKCIAANIRVGISTNGVHFSDSSIALISDNAELFDFVQVSLHAPDRENYFRIHGADNFDRVVGNIGRLNQARISYNVSSVIGRYNMQLAAEMYSLLEQLSVRRVSLSQVCQLGRAQLNNHVHIRFADYLAVLEHFNSLNAYKTMDIGTEYRPIVCDAIAEVFPNITFSPTNCSMYSVCHIEADGMAMLCPFIRDDINLRDEFVKYSVMIRNKSCLEDIWNSDSFCDFREFAHQSNVRKSYCQTCAYLQHGRCVPCPLNTTTCQEQTAAIEAYRSRANV